VITYIALLRAVNVGGTGKLPMPTLIEICKDAGFKNTKTHIASGNAVFNSGFAERKVQSLLEAGLQKYAGKPVGVVIRTSAEMAAVLAANPFARGAPNRTVAIFLAAAPAKDALSTISGQRHEEMALGVREIYVHYGDGMASTKLKIPAAKLGTARNMNTVAKLANIAAELTSD
jgi:uncharacterized protein (DUF1697 family)